MSTRAGQPLSPCRKDGRRLDAHEIAARLRELPLWRHHRAGETDQLRRDYDEFPDFASALRFANQVGALAEAANHHPTLTIGWGRVGVAWWTHVLGGLHDNDFIMAARCDALLKGGAPPTDGAVQGGTRVPQ
jgi:4a-hydroxytetrahydrobiopterin dehydratase